MEKDLYKLLVKLGNKVPIEKPEDILFQLCDIHHAHLHACFQSMIHPQAPFMGAAGEKLKKAIEEETAKFRDTLYKYAMLMDEDVSFNLAPLQSAAKVIQNNILSWAVSPCREEKNDCREKLKALLKTLLVLHPRVRKFSTDEGVWTAFEQLDALRIRLSDLRRSDDVLVRQSVEVLWKQLTNVMNSPISSNSRFLNAYGEASAYNAFREDTLELGFIADILRSESPDEIMCDLFSIGNYAKLAKIEELIQPDDWRSLCLAFERYLASSQSGKAGLIRLAEFEKRTPEMLALMLSDGKIQEIKEFLSTQAQFEEFRDKLLFTTRTDQEMFIAMAKECTVEQIKYAVMLTGGLEGAYAQAVRVGVYKNILMRSLKRLEFSEFSDESINAYKLLEVIEEWQKSRKLGSRLITTR